MPLAFVPCVICVVKGERVGGWEEVVEKDQGFRCFVFFTEDSPALSLVKATQPWFEVFTVLFLLSFE